MVFSGLGMIWGGFTVAYPDFMDVHRWLGLVGMAVGLIVLVWALFLDVEIKSPFKLTFKLHRPWRIPLIDLYEKAEARGWTFLSGGNLTVLDFAKAFRQGALDGRISIWGRALQAMDVLTEAEPLIPIPQDHWKNHELDGIAVLRYSTNGQVLGLTKNNLRLRTQTIPLSAHYGCFADIHVKRNEAMRWLKRDAPEYLGQTEKTDGNWQVS